MFVFVDTDKQSTHSDSLVIRNGSQFMFDLSLDDAPVSLFFSDGDNNKKINVTFSHDSLFGSMELSDTMNAKGVVSASESFTIESNQELKINPKRACIGSTVSIGLEGDDLINELFEQEGIEFEITSKHRNMSGVDYNNQRKWMPFYQNSCADSQKVKIQTKNHAVAMEAVHKQGNTCISENINICSGISTSRLSKSLLRYMFCFHYLLK